MSSFRSAAENGCKAESSTYKQTQRPSPALGASSTCQCRRHHYMKILWIYIYIYMKIRILNFLNISKHVWKDHFLPSCFADFMRLKIITQIIWWFNHVSNEGICYLERPILLVALLWWVSRLIMRKDFWAPFRNTGPRNPFQYMYLSFGCPVTFAKFCKQHLSICKSQWIRTEIPALTSSFFLGQCVIEDLSSASRDSLKRQHAIFPRKPNSVSDGPITQFHDKPRMKPIFSRLFGESSSVPCG